MKYAKIFMALMLACSGTFANPTPAEISAQVQVFRNQMPETSFIDSFQHVSFKYFVDYIKAVYPNASTEKYNTTAAILTYGLYTNECGTMEYGAESDLDTVKVKILTLHNYHWRNLIMKYPNRDNVILKVAAYLTIDFTENICTWLGFPGIVRGDFNNDFKNDFY